MAITITGGATLTGGANMGTGGAPSKLRGCPPARSAPK